MRAAAGLLGWCNLSLNHSLQDLNREVVKTDSATTRIPELDFEIPAFSQKGGGYMVIPVCLGALAVVLGGQEQVAAASKALMLRQHATEKVLLWVLREAFFFAEDALT